MGNLELTTLRGEATCCGNGLDAVRKDVVGLVERDGGVARSIRQLGSSSGRILG